MKRSLLILALTPLCVHAAGKRSGRFSPSLPTIQEEGEQKAALAEKQPAKVTMSQETKADLIAALHKDNAEKIEKLLQQHPELLNAPLHGGGSLLNLAAYHDKQKVAAYVLDQKGIHVDQRDSDQMTPLMWAATKGNSDIASMLLQHGADISLTDRFGKTASYYASAYPAIKKEIAGYERQRKKQR